ncbi:hypothetical protein CLOSTMETH_01088 [[Clostridium] methylpentosum DSM 5476]|uniref:CobQ/CobB/MinD/ParA nucleotide binding domain-containing protein n=1 Tax=[Clostridium] methylpentosum DSM 5476 TaxID=537013 RepID=C0EB71_9FIRM|nr:hypothetical protein CLOSTMETH_01088 [[Clostridium] methylpentosum DSM 5476]MEE1491726.1 AAA family ATPase [Massilioclostridium sp.]
MNALQTKRISVVTGHYGSGKTNFSVNLALWLARQGKRVCVVDLDTVNPYFRTADYEQLFASQGVELIVPEFANTNLDLPVLSSRIGAVLQDESVDVVVDAGGDDAGAAVLGCYAQQILSQPHEVYYLYNSYRYHTEHPDEAAEILRAIEAASRLKVTKIINNSNLGGQTQPRDLIDSVEPAQKLAALTGVPLAASLVKASLAKEVPQAYPIEVFVKII